MNGDDTEEIRKKSEELTQVSHKLAEAIYQQATAGQGAEGHQGHGGAGAAGGTSPKDDDVVDADFEEVKDDKK